MYWLGLDIGTGGSRALLVDEKGVLKAGFTAPHEDMRMEKPLWAEQRPEDWWQAAQKAVQGVLAEAKVKGKQVAGVGLSGQMHGLVLLDEENQVIRPALIWCDQRSQVQVDHINQVGREEQRPDVHGQSGADRLHAAEAAVGARQRAAVLRPRAKGAASQGLHSLRADRGVRHGGLGCLRHLAVRRGPAPLVAPDARPAEAGPRAIAAGL